MNDNVIHLAIPATGEYRRWAEVTAESARRGSSLPIDVIFLDWNNVDRVRMESYGQWHGSAIAWSRLFLSEILPSTVEWVISCDADMLFNGDIAKLWALRDEHSIVIGSRDSLLPGEKCDSIIADWCHTQGIDIGEEEKMFCSGLTLINLKRWREEGWQTKVEAWLAQYRDAPFLDQTALNIVFRDQKAVLPRQWGAFSGDANLDVDYEGDCAIHYVDDPPWRRDKITRLMSDAVVKWRRLAGMSVGGWRRWLWVVLRATHPLWGWNRRMSWHFRNAVWQKKTALLQMHPAAYHEPVNNVLRAKGSIDIFSVYNLDPNHIHANFTEAAQSVNSEPVRVSIWKLFSQFVFSGKYHLVIWPAYYPYWLTLPIVMRALIHRRYAVCLDTTNEYCGRLSRFVKAFMFKRAQFLWVPGMASRDFLMRQYGISSAKIIDGLYEVEDPPVCAVRRLGTSSRRGQTYLMVANDTPNRRMDVVVEAFKRFGKGRLQLIGKGSSKWGGIESVPYAELGKYYDEADVYVHNGNEQYSTAVQIAAKRGMWIICSKDVGIVRDFEPTVTVDDWQSVDAWVEAFNQLDNKESRQPRIFKSRIDQTVDRVNKLLHSHGNIW